MPDERRRDRDRASARRACRRAFTPSRLIAVFCRPELLSGFRPCRRDDAERHDWHAGFCSYPVVGAYAPGVDGFGRRIDSLGRTGPPGWTVIENPDTGQFSLAFQMMWRPVEREQLEAAFAQAGGRGVETAERLDELRESPDGNGGASCTTAKATSASPSTTTPTPTRPARPTPATSNPRRPPGRLHRA